MTARAYHRPRAELSAAEKARLRRAYVESDVTVEAIQKRFGIAARKIKSIAQSEGWPLRPGRFEEKADA
jgi:transposase-like protein